MRLESWQNAQNQAIAAARNMCGDDAPYAETPWVWSDQYDLNLQFCGETLSAETHGAATHGAEETLFRGSLDEASDGFIAFQRSGKKIIGAVAANRARDMRVARTIIEERLEIPFDELCNDSINLRKLLKKYR